MNLSMVVIGWSGNFRSKVLIMLRTCSLMTASSLGIKALTEMAAWKTRRKNKKLMDSILQTGIILIV